MVLKLKTAWRDGTTHLVMSPLELIERIPPRTHRRQCGALAANSPLSAALAANAGACQAMSQSGDAPHFRSAVK